MAYRRYEGVGRESEVSALRMREDLRPWSAILRDWWLTPDGQIYTVIGLFVALIAFCWVPLAAEMLLLAMGGFCWLQMRYRKRSWDFPFRVPMAAKLIDGSTKKMGAGLFHLGSESSTKMPVSASDNDARTHALIFGTTGSGKTEFLLAFIVNSLIYGGGGALTDGKGDVKLWLKFLTLARLFGREDDLLLISFITSGHEFYDRQETKISNTINPYQNGSSGMCTEASIALMDSSGGGDDMWKGRAIAFLGGLIKPFTFLRDRGEILLDSELLRTYFDLPLLEKLVWDEADVWKGGVKREKGYFRAKYGKVWNAVIRPLEAFMVTIPGYDKSRIGKQEQKTLEQHGYIVMQLARLFGDMSDNYGHIMKTPLGEVDMYDVVINERILVTLLPALERSPASLGMLGKIIVGGMKQMAAGCLGNKVEGLRREIVDARPTTSPVPFPTIFDEYGYYAVLGFASMPAQARSLGFMVIFAAQDFASLKKSSPEEADQTWENTNIRGVGRITSGSEAETYKRMVALGGEVEVAEIEGFEVEHKLLGRKLRASDRLRLVRKPRVNHDDLHSQADGEFHLFMGKKSRDAQYGNMQVVRTMAFYTETELQGHKDSQPGIKYLRINHFARVRPPNQIFKAASNPLITGENGLRKVIEQKTLETTIFANRSTNPPAQVCSYLVEQSRALGENGLGLMDAALAAMALLDKYELLRRSELQNMTKEYVSELPPGGRGMVRRVETTGAADSGEGGDSGGRQVEVRAVMPKVLGLPPGLGEASVPKPAPSETPAQLGLPPTFAGMASNGVKTLGAPPQQATAAPASLGKAPVLGAVPRIDPVPPAEAEDAKNAVSQVGNVDGGETMPEGAREALAKVSLFMNGAVDIPVNDATPADVIAVAEMLLQAGGTVFGKDAASISPDEARDEAMVERRLQATVRGLDQKEVVDMMMAADPRPLGPTALAQAREEGRAFVEKMALGNTYLETPLPSSQTPVSSFLEVVEALTEAVMAGANQEEKS